MKVHSYTILHYGKDYLSYALRSVYHSVDQLNVFYTPNPSHGHSTIAFPIETKEELMKAAFAYDPEGKVKWFDMLGITHEGPQRDLALKYCQDQGADLVLVVDYDEVWPSVDKLNQVLYEVYEWDGTRKWLVNMIHFWRSFNWVCRDDGWPVRVIDLRQSEGDSVEYIERELTQVFHFGYAVTDKVMQYKWQIHGHKNELREGWFEKVWAGESLLSRSDLDSGVHPTNSDGFWIPEPFDKTKLPEFMREHPFYDLERIE